MPNISWGTNDDDWRGGPADSEPFTPPAAAPQQPSYSAPNSWADDTKWSQIDQGYQTLLGRRRDPNDVQFANDPNWYSNLSQSQEAKNYAARPQTSAAPTGGGGDPRSLWTSWYQSAGAKPRQSQNTSLQPFVDYLKTQGIDARVNVDPHGFGKGIDINGKFVKLLDGNDNPIWDDFSGGGEGQAGGGYGDPSSQLYLNEMLSRMQQLRQPVNDPLAPLYQLMAMTRIKNLQGDPYTAGEDAALTARYMNPLTHARDAELQQNKERIGARGMLASSGLLDELNKGTNRSYQMGVAQHSNDLGVRAVDEKQRRQDEQLSVLSDLLRFGQSSRREEDSRGQELIDLASQFPAFDERRLDQMLRASSDGGAAQSASGNLIAQQSQRLQQQLLQSNNDAQRDAAWGEFFGTLLNNWDDIF